MTTQQGAKTKARPKRDEMTPRPIEPSKVQGELLKAVDLPLQQVAELASLGLTKEQIGYFYGLHPWSLAMYQRQRPELNEALERGRAAGIEHAAAALRKQITAGNISAIIFYLKSRGKWREINTMELTGKDGQPIAFESKTNLMDLSLLGEEDLLGILSILSKATRPLPRRGADEEDAATAEGSDD